MSDYGQHNPQKPHTSPCTHRYAAPYPQKRALLAHSRRSMPALPKDNEGSLSRTMVRNLKNRHGGTGPGDGGWI